MLSWHSLTPWRVDGRSCEAGRADGAAVRVTTFAVGDQDDGCTLSATEDAVHRREGGEHVPAYRAAVSTPADRRHRLLSVVQTTPPGREPASPPRLIDGPVLIVEVTDAAGQPMRVACGGGSVAMWGCATDGALLAAVQGAGDTAAAAAALGGTWLTTPCGRVEGGAGLLTLPA